MRRGVLLLLLGAAAVALGTAAAAHADGTTTTGTTTGATTTTAAPTYVRLPPSYLPATCVGAGDAAIAEPNRRELALGTPASGRGPSSYPAIAPVVSFNASSASGSTCSSARVTLESVSLFGGFVTASSVEAAHGRGTVSGVEIDGSPVSLASGESALLGYWGQLTLGRTVGRLTAPLVVLLLKRHWALPAGTTIFVGFAASAQPVQKSKPKGDSTASKRRTTTPAAGSPAQSRPEGAGKRLRHRKRPVPQPLAARPSLGYRPGHYAFPVDGGASFVDTYGANRNDIYDGWHHGDDLFSPLGTPVVAVANGTLGLVGWNRLGGWRLWLTDGKGNSFYYAHLAGYSRWVLQHPHVRVGQVIGFLGRTGDAFTTTPHLHFELHPHQYLKRGYDGAVDPTTYLQKWKVVHVPAKEIPRPAKLKAPVGMPRQEAAVVWHELLAARHLLPVQHPARVAAGLRLPLRPPRILEGAGGWPPPVATLRRTAAHVSAPASLTPWLGGGTGAVALAVLSAGAFAIRRRRRDRPEAPLH